MNILAWILTGYSILLALIELVACAYMFRVAWVGRQETKRLAAEMNRRRLDERRENHT